MSEALHTLHEKGYAIAVLSNKQDAYVKKIVGLLFPDGIVVHAQGQTDLPIKPDPTVPLMIARALGFSPEETIFIGDSDVDIITGKNAGMRTVGCAWGYRGRENLVAAGADHVIDHASELLDLFS
jgi:phosphoglycolate phosphatase